MIPLNVESHFYRCANECFCCGASCEKTTTRSYLQIAGFEKKTTTRYQVRINSKPQQFRAEKVRHSVMLPPALLAVGRQTCVALVAAGWSAPPALPMCCLLSLMSELQKLYKIKWKTKVGKKRHDVRKDRNHAFKYKFRPRGHLTNIPVGTNIDIYLYWYYFLRAHIDIAHLYRTTAEEGDVRVRVKVPWSQQETEYLNSEPTWTAELTDWSTISKKNEVSKRRYRDLYISLLIWPIKPMRSLVLLLVFDWVFRLFVFPYEDRRLLRELLAEIFLEKGRLQHFFQEF